jgi:DNA-binding NarL/FixJ family response regulator
MIRVVIVDDLPVVRTGLRKFLSLAPDIEVVGTAANGEEALDLVARVEPNVVLMDVEMPVLDGVAATREIRQRHPHIHVVLLTLFDNDRYVLKGLQAGAVSYLLKDAEDDEIISAIRAAAEGQSILHPRAATRVVAHITANPLPTIELTQREQEILRLVGQGRTNQMIAQRLSLSEGTVKNHLTNILTKLETTNRMEAVFRAKDMRLI